MAGGPSRETLTPDCLFQEAGGPFVDETGPDFLIQEMQVRGIGGIALARHAKGASARRQDAQCLPEGREAK